MLVVFIATVGYGISFPLLAISIESMGLSNRLIGLNAAMPAVGWIVASILIPRMHSRYSTRFLMIAFITVACTGLVGFTLSENYLMWLLCRLLFGGGLGMFFRTLEYYLNTNVANGSRGKILGLYITVFLAGIIVGSVLQPVFGVTTLVPFAAIFGCLILSAILLQLSGMKASPDLQTGAVALVTKESLSNLYILAPVAAISAVVYGLVESIPAYLMPVYALKIGFDESYAAYTLTAFAVGNLIFAFPLGILSDAVGRLPVIFCCALAGAFGFLSVPFIIDNLVLFYSALVIIGGCIVGVYTISLALVGDKYSQSSLIYANASFGILYALGSLIGPVVHGSAMDIYEPHGLILSATLVFIVFLVAIPILWKVEHVRKLPPSN